VKFQFPSLRNSTLYSSLKFVTYNVKWGTAFVDFDNDGWLDLIAVAGHVYPQVDQWPSGQVETLKDLQADKFYGVLEGQGIVPVEKIAPVKKASGAKR